MKKRSVPITGFLDRETAVVGELRVGGNLRLDGEFHGQIVVDGALFVGETAQIHADVKAHAVDVHGNLSGTVVARDRLDLRKSGRILGDIQSPVLVIEDGGVLIGRSRMSEEEETPGARRNSPGDAAAKPSSAGLGASDARPD